MKRTGWMRWLERGLFFLGLVLVGVWLQNLSETYAFQAEESARLDRGLQDLEADGVPAANAETNAPESDAPDVLGRIEIPRLGVSAMIAEGIEPEVLERAIGHVTTTSRPGEPGNVGLAGHRDTFFRGLRRVRLHDRIRIVTLGGTYTYRVEWKSVVGPRRVDLLDSTRTPSLTLVTCYPFELIGHAPKRFVVRATLVARAGLLARDASVASAPPRQARPHRTSERGPVAVDAGRLMRGIR